MVVARDPCDIREFHPGRRFVGATQVPGCSDPGEPLWKDPEATPGIRLCHRPRVTEEDKAPKPSPSPGGPAPCPAACRPSAGSGGSRVRSGLPLSHTEEDKGILGDMAHEHSQWEAVMEQEMSQEEEAVGGQQECGWDEDERSQEPSIGSVPEDSQGEDVPELSQGEAERHQELSPREDDLHSYISPWEHQREPELSPARDSSDEELSGGAEAGAQEPSQREEDIASSTSGEAEAGPQEPSQREEDVASSTGDKALRSVSEEEPQPGSPQGPGSPSPVGTALAAEAAPALPSASPAPGSPPGAEPAAAAPAGDAGREELPEPVAAGEEEKAVEASVPSQELPSAGTQSPVPAPQSPQGCSPALLDLAWHISSEIVCRALLEIQGSGQQPQGPPVEKAAESPVPSQELPSLGTQSPLSVPYNIQDSSPALLCREQSSSGQLLSQAQLQQLQEQDAQEEAAGAAPSQRQHSPLPGKSHMEEELSQQEGAQEAEQSLGSRSNSQGGSQGEDRADQELPQQVSDRKEPMEEEMSQGEVNNSQEDSDWEEYLEKELLQEILDWEENMEQELSQRDINSQEEVSNWEEHNGQGFSPEELSLGQDVSRGNNHGHSVHSSWEDDSDPELAQDLWQVGSNSGIWMKPLALEDDEWDEVSILELPPEDKEQEQRAFVADELPLPVPCEAWVEEQKPELRSPGLLCASLAPLEGQAPGRYTASPSQALHGQPRAPRKLLSHFRWALRRLFCCSCLAAPPEE
ncbi:fibrous sheath CABYR-binding protein-like [Vidua chalybeata]|uniref:fibrous sheath CABYR-binding protein-like n=1 Tax=Vidua chalybeata TaxID=81927 RepID=UPI0023A8B819|nr:fibrous sheath CABYR-binding protein-like [Vidua chalybeata]